MMNKRSSLSFSLSPTSVLSENLRYQRAIPTAGTEFINGPHKKRQSNKIQTNKLNDVPYDLKNLKKSKHIHVPTFH